MEQMTFSQQYFYLIYVNNEFIECIISLQLKAISFLNIKELQFEMIDNKTLSAAQIRYLRIGPRANQSQTLKQQLIQAIEEENKSQQSDSYNGLGSLNQIPKYGYSQLSKTVNNFGILINHNFGTSSSLHQVQKFGKLAKQVDLIMQAEKDKPQQQIKKNSSRSNQKEDKRTLIKSIYNYQGEKIFVVLHSFSIQAIGQNYKEVFPFSEMKLLVSKVNSAKLSQIVQSALRFETETVEMNFDRLKQKIAAYTNNQQKYQNLPYKFQKIGTEFKINVPTLEFTHIESNFRQTAMPTNKDILQITKQQFENIHDIVYKYFDHENFSKELDEEDKMESKQGLENEEDKEEVSKFQQNENEVHNDQ